MCTSACAGKHAQARTDAHHVRKTSTFVLIIVCVVIEPSKILTLPFITRLTLATLLSNNAVGLLLIVQVEGLHQLELVERYHCCLSSVVVSADGCNEFNL